MEWGGSLEMTLARRVFVGLLLTTALMMPVAVEASAPISLQVLVGDTCVSGTGGANKNVSASLRTASGHGRDSFTTTSDENGQWFGCFSLFLPSSTINGGDLLHVSVGGSSRTVRVPRLMPTIDRVANTISGRAAADTQVSVNVTHHPSFTRSRNVSFEAMSDAQGNWSVNTTGTVNLIGADEVTALTFSGSDLFGAQTSAPYVLVQHANNAVSGVSNPGVAVSFMLHDGHGAEKGRGNSGTNLYGDFAAGLVDANRDAAYPIGGDSLQSDLASDARLRIPVSELRGTASTDTVSGRCMANAPYLLLTFNGSYAGRTDANGRFSRSVARKENLRKGDQLRLACMYPTGDIWLRTANSR
jgi:hypothetical protein